MARSKSSHIGGNNAAAVTIAVTRAAARWTPGSHVCVALSGGSDSMVLLHALATLRSLPASAWSLSAHHVHHGLSVNADSWAAHCEAACAPLSVPLTIDRVSVDQHAGLGVEAAARDARLTSLDQVVADVIVFAHHARDQAETLLLQLLRGSGPAGMAAMPSQPSHAGGHERPLLSVSKAALQDYATLHQLQWINDESNHDHRFSRNRLRHAVWPAIVGAFPAAEMTLCRAAQLQAEASTLINDLAAIDAASCVVDNTLRLSVFNSLSDPRRANLLRFWLLENGVGPPPADTLREWLKQLASSNAIQAIELRGSQQTSVIRVFRGHAVLAGDAHHWLPIGWAGETSVTLKGGKNIAGTVDFSPAIATANASAFRAPRANESWLLRARQDGDGVAISERSGHVALKNLFQHAGIPPWQRSTWPLLLCNNEIVAVASIATAKAFTVAPGETGIVCQWKPA